MHDLLAVALFQIFAIISPGPDFALVSHYSMVNSRKAGMLAGAGIAMGACIHMIYGALGFGVLLTSNPELFKLLRFAGSLYLCFIGCKIIRSRDTWNCISTNSQEKNNQPFLSGLFTNLLNPKAVLFTLSFFTTVLPLGTSLEMQLYYSFQIGLIALVWFFFVSKIFSSSLIAKLNECSCQIIGLIFGIMLIFIGIKVGFGY